MGNGCGKGSDGTVEHTTRDLDDLKKKLNKGSGVKVDINSFENWGATQKKSKVLEVRPTKLEEVQALVKGCRELGLRIRAAGATHSWGPMFTDEGHVIMYTDKLKPFDGERMSVWQVLVVLNFSK